ncbi:MAG: metallophosphoesterase [Gammaproteobacteria bacterium]|nr:metallophosphoesterase [Gammaproteobacteria bacterium]
MNKTQLTTVALVGALLLATVSAQAEREEKYSRGQGTFEFALIGDTPYFNNVDPGADYPPFDHLVEDINRNRKLQWVMHAGDIKNGSTECSDALFHDRLARFSHIEKPLIYTPGDNEWTDCHRINNGQYQPLERLARLRELFFAVPGMTLGAVPMQVESQAQTPGYEEFPENVRWSHNRVLFATLHIVGSNNALAPFQSGTSAVRTQADDDEVARRNAANLAWLNATFDQAERDRAPGVLIMIQANPGLEFDQSVTDRYGFEDFLAMLEQRTAAFGGPVVLAHGDSHYFRIDKPRLLNQAFLPNLTRVETFGSGNVHWIRVQVDPRSDNVFRFQQEIVEKNR